MSESDFIQTVNPSRTSNKETLGTAVESNQKSHVTASQEAISEASGSTDRLVEVVNNQISADAVTSRLGTEADESFSVATNSRDSAGSEGSRFSEDSGSKMPDSESPSAGTEPEGGMVVPGGGLASPVTQDVELSTGAGVQTDKKSQSSDTTSDSAQSVASTSNATTTEENATSEIIVSPDSNSSSPSNSKQQPVSDTNLNPELKTVSSDTSKSDSNDTSGPLENVQSKLAGDSSDEPSSQDAASAVTAQYNLKVDLSNAKTKPSEGAANTKPKTVTAAMVSDAIAMAKASEGAEGGSDAAPIQCVYHVKWIKYKGNLCPIVTQNENGPCPLLAIMNVLLLQGKVKLSGMIEMVTSGQLMEYLADCIFENAPKNITEDAQLNYEQNMHDAMAVFHKLQTGLDVNVKFTGVSDFEYTPECIVFDLLAIHLYHGWLVDPESPNEVTALSQCSYNQLVEKIILNKNSDKEEIVTEALIAEDFINRTASQLTYHGLLELVTTIKEGELCVFFRNNHFSTVLKNKDELFLLVTDQGFLTESNVVWETLSNVEGDGHFVDGEFHTYRKPAPSTHTIPTPHVTIGSDQQIDQDYLVALSIQQEQTMVEQTSVAGAPPAVAVSHDWAPPSSGQHLSDHELALRLQEEENRRGQQGAAAERRASNTNDNAANNGNKQSKKSGDCVIL